PLLVPRRQPQGDVVEPGVEVRAKLLDALPRAAGRRPALDEARAELRGVVGIEERLALLERRLAILVHVDVVVQGAAQLARVAPLLPRHGGDARPLLAELVGADLVGHPAVGVAGDAAEAALDDRRLGAGAVAPGESGGVAGDPDRTGIL